MRSDGLINRKGWIKVNKADVAYLGEQLNNASTSPKAVWLALLTLADERRAAKFKVSVNLIASIAAVSRGTTKSALKSLAENEFITIAHHRIPGRKEWDECTYTLLRGEYAASRSVNNCPRSVNSGAQNSDQCIKPAQTAKNLPPLPTVSEADKVYVLRFREIRTEYQDAARFPDIEIAAALAACPPGPDRERGFDDLERAARPPQPCPRKPLPMLRSYMQTAAQGPKVERRKKHDKKHRSGEFAEPSQPVPVL